MIYSDVKGTCPDCVSSSDGEPLSSQPAIFLSNASYDRVRSKSHLSRNEAMGRQSIGSLAESDRKPLLSLLASSYSNSLYEGEHLKSACSIQRFEKFLSKRPFDKGTSPVRIPPDGT